jgi:signal transduction histidine kinase
VFAIARQYDPGVPFVFVSDTLGEERAVAMMRAGAGDCLRKGHLENLSVTVRRELEAAAEERRRLAASSAMKFQQRRYQSLFEAAPVALLEVDLSSARRFIDVFADQVFIAPGGELLKKAVEGIRVLAANAAALELLGAERPEQVLEPRALHSPQRDVWLDILNALAAPEPRFRRQVVIRTLDGRDVEVLLAFRLPATAGQLRNVVLSMTDVASRAGLEGQIQTARRMDAVGRLAGRVAHDFNNLLTVIKGYSGLLLETLPADDPSRKDLRTIDEAATSAEQLTRQLQLCSRPQGWEPAALSLNRIVSHCRVALQDTLGADVDLSMVLADGLWEVEVDPGCLEQILLSLAANARDAMPDGGRLTIETANTRLEDGETPMDVPPGDYVMLTVRDNGRGMDRETLHRAFEPYFTTKDRGRQSGLGLSTVYGIVKQANGLVWADSEPGAGSAFEILLPRRQLPGLSSGSG